MRTLALEAKLDLENTDEYSLLKDLEEHTSGKSYFTTFLFPYLKITWCFFFFNYANLMPISFHLNAQMQSNCIGIWAPFISFPFFQGSYLPLPVYSSPTGPQ